MFGELWSSTVRDREMYRWIILSSLEVKNGLWNRVTCESEYCLSMFKATADACCDWECMIWWQEIYVSLWLGERCIRSIIKYDLRCTHIHTDYVMTFCGQLYLGNQKSAFFTCYTWKSVAALNVRELHYGVSQLTAKHTMIVRRIDVIIWLNERCMQRIIEYDQKHHIATKV